MAARRATVACITISALGLVAAALHPVDNNDTFGHLAQGRQIAELGYVPTVDTFSFFRDTPQPWLNYEWGSDLLFWWAWQLGGANGLLALVSLLLGATAVLLVLRARPPEPLGPLACTAWILAVLPLIRFRLEPRPHVFGFALAALLLVGLRHLMTAPPGSRATAVRWVAGLGLAQVLWVNLHGSHLLGMLLTAIHLGASLREPIVRGRLAFLLAAQLAASCVSPFGPAILLDAVAHVLDPSYRELVAEWQAWSPELPLAYLLGPAVATALIVPVARPLLRSGHVGIASTATLVLLALMAFRSVRFLAEYLLLAAPLMATGFASLASRWPARRVTRVLVALGTAAAAFAVPAWSRLPPDQALGLGLSERGLPAGVGRFLQRHAPAARVHAPMQDAWYLMFAVPEAKLLLDGRVPFYGVDHVREVAEARQSATTHARLLERFGVDALVVEHASRRDWHALRAARTLDSWHLVYVDDVYALFLRESAERAPWLDERTLHTLPPGWEPAPLLAPETDVGRVRSELSLLEGEPAAAGYRAFVRAMLALRPLARRGAAAGLRAAADPDEQRRACEAHERLVHASEGPPEGVPIVDAWRALAAIACCELEDAERALERARAAGEVRETLLGRAEIALRRGEVQTVRELLSHAAALPEARGDPWLAAVGRDLAAGVRCSPSW